MVECGKLLQREDYRVKILNTINFKKSHHYNPFQYIHSEKDILKLVTTLIANTKGDGKSSDPFWEKAETLLYTAIIGYILIPSGGAQAHRGPFTGLWACLCPSAGRARGARVV